MDVPGLGRVEDISPDARHLLFLNPDGIFSIRLNGPSQERVPMAVVKTGEEVYVPRFSPDGRWIVYMARTPNGLIGIYVQSFPAQDFRKQIADSGRFPVWRKDGKEIVYYDQDRICFIWCLFSWFRVFVAIPFRGFVFSWRHFWPLQLSRHESPPCPRLASRSRRPA